MRFIRSSSITASAFIVTAAISSPVIAVDFFWSATADTFGWFDRETPQGPPGFSPWRLNGGEISGQAPDDAMDRAFLSTNGKTTTLGSGVTVEEVQITADQAVLQLNGATLTAVDGFSIFASAGELAFSGGTVNSSNTPLHNAGIIRTLSGSGTGAIVGDVNNSGSVIVGGGTTFDFDGATFTQTGGDFTVNTGGTADFFSGKSFLLQGGSVVINGVFDMRTDSTFVQDGGTLINNSSFSISNRGGFSHNSGVTTNNGDFVVSGAAEFSYNGGVINGDAIEIDEGTLNLNVPLSASASEVGDADFTFTGGGSLTGNVHAETTLTIDNSAGAAVVDAGDGVLENEGEILLVGGAISGRSELSFQSSGGMTNRGKFTAGFSAGSSNDRRLDGNGALLTNTAFGELLVEPGANLFVDMELVNTGSIDIGAGGTLSFGSHDVTMNGGTLNNDGRVLLGGSSNPVVRFNGGSLSGNAVELDNAILEISDSAGPAAFRFIGSLSNQFSGNVAAGQGLRVDASAEDTRLNVGMPSDDDNSFSNAGEIVLTGAGTRTAELILFGNLSTLTNIGVIRASGPGAGVQGRQIRGVGQIVNMGQLEVDPDTTLSIEMLTVNSGTIDIAPGALLSTDRPGVSAFTQDSGVINNNGAFRANAFTYNGGTITGNPIEIIGNRLTLAPGTGPVSFVIRGPGALSGNINVGQAVELFATSGTIDTPTEFANNGTLVQNGNGTGVNVFRIGPLFANLMFTNNGAYIARNANASGAGGERSISGELDNFGTATIEANVTYEALSTINHALFTVDAGAAVELSSGQSFRQQDGDLINNGSFEVRGTFTFNGGDIVGNPISLINGTLLFGGAVTGNGNFLMFNGGSFGGNVSPNAVVRFVSPASGVRIVNQGSAPASINNRGELFFDNAAGGIVRLLAGSGQTVIVNDAEGLISGNAEIGFTSAQETFTNRGVIAPGDDNGDATGLIHVVGDLNLEETSQLSFEIGGTAVDEFDRITSIRPILVDGTLHVSLINGFTPDLGDTFNILSSSGNVSGLFLTDASQLPVFRANLDWRIDHNPNGVVLSAVESVRPQGDYSGDGVVDAVDYSLWRDTLGSTTDLRADGDNDGTITSADFDVWRTNFGAVATGPASAPAPEPAGETLLALATLALTGRFGCQRSRARRISRSA